MDDHVGDVLGAEGPFAREVPGFVPREVQMAMAEAVAAAIDERHTLIAEAGTGTGKTFAYLVPALLSGKRVIVSTGTKALQDQLFHRDLPRVRSVLGARLSAALLKGRANYLCLHRLEQARTEGQFASRQQVSDLQRIHAWSTSTRHGDRAELAELAEDSPLWPRVTSTTDNCLGSECAFFNDCFVVKARRAAQEADVVVVNHHLLFADLAIKQEGFGEILPGAHAFILDEAHQVPELAGQFFSVSLSARQLAELVRDTIAECGAVTGVLGILQPLTEAITTAVRKLRLAMDGFPGRAALKRIERDAEVEAGIEGLRLALEALVNGLAPHNERSRGLDSVHERAQSALARLNQLMDGSARDSVHWYELSAQGFSLHSTPLDLAQPLRELREQSHAAWIFTSATLSIAGDFTHFARQLGLDDPHTVCLQSPFDYQRQALAYLPAGLPEPNTDTHTERVVEAVIPVLAASQGRAFLLFTSHRALRRAADLLADRVPWPLFVQGSAPRHQLLEEFRASGNGVLLGAASFWEGVDVAGDALSVVVIDKLPFAAPDDPVLAARLETLREAGLKPFFDWQIPNAVIALKQGAGRLIRDIHDRGVLVLCDPRLTSKGYGRIFLASLPDMPRTTDIGAVQAFFGA
ncbi:MAG: ATP-dependent DNA helicase [Dokdonella sp.]|jgi:ATP-dependent DNA helicase DinG|uniref:ATP-dependent DNA helicase n=1 Tax=Dokdonella sp. TaxID=2291710 RepID=UPI001B6EE13E|nr:ATP-dependent DNA helicase [Dokdonella sp.]MBK8123252.1 ATP-dependent DNA helicase [Dokdonella sp.]MBP6327993.1 ATP-dependent DNA helicase [Dokdonella sp.]MBP6330608.1 ATP-dependent DNA helicase [Dokdonella sp.]HQV50518.1 ATP-dependent DNA helicase [Dokdonella sp.]